MGSEPRRVTGSVWTPTDEPFVDAAGDPVFHGWRVEDAAAMTRGDGDAPAPALKAFEDAVEGSGVV